MRGKGKELALCCSSAKPFLGSCLFTRRTFFSSVPETELVETQSLFRLLGLRNPSSGSVILSTSSELPFSSRGRSWSLLPVSLALCCFLFWFLLSAAVCWFLMTTTDDYYYYYHHYYFYCYSYYAYYYCCYHHHHHHQPRYCCPVAPSDSTTGPWALSGPRAKFL